MSNLHSRVKKRETRPYIDHKLRKSESVQAKYTLSEQRYSEQRFRANQGTKSSMFFEKRNLMDAYSSKSNVRIQ